MAAWSEIERTMTERLGLSRRPIAVAFRELPPAGVAALVAGRPGRLMLLLEAASGAGVATQPGLCSAAPPVACLESRARATSRPRSGQTEIGGGGGSPLATTARSVTRSTGAVASRLRRASHAM